MSLPISNADALTEYEQRRLTELQAWIATEPGWIARSLDRASSPAARALQRLVPPEALMAALNGSDRFAQQIAGRLGNEATLLRRARLSDIDDLQRARLETCDRLARGVQRRATLLAGGSGAVTGVAGALGSAVDIPTLLTLSLLAIHRSALCYGERVATNSELALTLLALASANRQADRLAALRALLQSEGPDVSLALESLEMATHRELAKQTISASVANLSRQLGVNLGQRKAAGVVPVLGALISGSVNAWFVHDVCRNAQFAFTARRLGVKADALPGESTSV